MKIDILASGSKGNCISIRTEICTILVDAGIAKTKIEKSLLEVGIIPNQVDAIFITHAHGDHVKGLPLANKYRIPVYAAEDEWKSIKGVDEDLKYHLKPNKYVTDIGYSVQVFQTYHDAFSPVGYAFNLEIEGEDKTQKVSICLDTGKVDIDMLEAMKHSDYYIIESNHEPAMVEHSNYPNSVKARILSHIGHLSNTQTAETLAQLVTGRGEKIYLTHLSSSNNLPALAKLTTMRALAKNGFKEGKHYEIEVF